MKIIEELGNRLVLVNEVERRLALIWRWVLLSVGVWIAAVVLYIAGLIPNTERYRMFYERGYVDKWSLLLGLSGALFCFISAFRFTYAYVTLDRGEGELKVERVRFFSPRTVKVIGLARVRRAQVGDKADMSRLEFELESGEVFAPSAMYTDYYAPPAMRNLTDKINQYLQPGATGKSKD
ncbi:MAG TPA: hypothetical protein VJ302_20225 [Blastocatellia bacterium]|nr:hypothetical protein [Blastocatellia bacterium]